MSSSGRLGELCYSEYKKVDIHIKDHASSVVFFFFLILTVLCRKGKKTLRYERKDYIVLEELKTHCRQSSYFSQLSFRVRYCTKVHTQGCFPQAEGTLALPYSTHSMFFWDPTSLENKCLY